MLYIFVFIPIEALVPTYGILDFEFTWTPERAEAILTVWGSQGILQETLAIYWDFLFIVGYVSLAFGLITLVLRRSENKLQKIGLFMATTPFLTGIFDIIENINLLVMLSNPTSILPPNPLIASISALLKFGFLFAAIIYFVIGLIFVLKDKIKKKNK